MTCRVARKIPAVQGHAFTCEALHVWHWRVMILVRKVGYLFFQNRKDTSRGAASFHTAADAGVSDANAVAIRAQSLIG